jgi:hypothetical protein
VAVSNTFSRFQVLDGCWYQKQVGFDNSVRGRTCFIIPTEVKYIACYFTRGFYH